MEITGENHLLYDFIVLVSHYSYNKLPLTLWLKITWMYYIIVWEVRNSSQDVDSMMFLLECLGENLLPCHFQLPEVTCTPWFVAPSSIFKARRTASWNISLSSFLPAPQLSTSIIIFSNPSAFLFKGLLWLYWVYLENPAKSSRLKILIISAKSFCRVK